MKACVIVLACLLIPLSVLARPGQHAVKQQKATGPNATSSSQPDPGEQVFAANCSRCHQAPMSLSPRITGTVVMHMRVRARLSTKDQQLLLKFLAP